MKKGIAILISFSAFLLFGVSSVHAQGAQQNKNQVPTTDLENVVAPGNQVQNKNQIQVQNQGETTQLQISTQNMEQLNTVLEDLSNTVGGEAGVLIKEQVQNQTKIQAQLEKIEARSAIVKKLFGPDYGAIRTLKQELEQSRLRLQELQQLKNQTLNQGYETELQEAILDMLDQNTVLEGQIQSEEQIGSIFGWLVKLFAR